MDGTAYWIGLTDLAHEGQFEHLTKKGKFLFLGTYRWQETHQIAEYTNWYPGGPNNLDSQDCVFKVYYPVYPGWHDAPCSWTSWEVYGQIHALCEAPK